MNKLSRDKKVQVIAAMVVGMGVNAISRMTGVCKNSVLRILEEVGRACAEYQDRGWRIHGLLCHVCGAWGYNPGMSRQQSRPYKQFDPTSRQDAR